MDLASEIPGLPLEMDAQLIERGYHLAYMDVAGKFGSPEATKRGNTFYQYLVDEHDLNSRPGLEGVSRGGLFVYNWAAENAGKISCILLRHPSL